jgi:predicted nucleotidyltransferase
LKRSNWTVAFAWVKASGGILGKELADQLSTTVAQAKDKRTSFSRIHLSTLLRQLEKSKLKWQQNWEESPKAAKINNYITA